jgi:hypothetical protein
MIGIGIPITQSNMPLPIGVLRFSIGKPATRTEVTSQP